MENPHREYQLNMLFIRLKQVIGLMLLLLASATESRSGEILLPSDVAARTAQAGGAIQLHREDSCFVLSQELQAGGPALYYPMEVHPDAFTGAVLHSDIREYQTRKAYYQDVLCEIMLMKDADLGDFRPTFETVRKLAGFFEALAATGDTDLTALRIFQLRTHTPQIANMYRHYPRMSTSLKWFKRVQEAVGPAATIAKGASDFCDVYHIYSINEQSVRDRAQVIRRLIESAPFKDAALVDALRDAEIEAVGMATGIEDAAVHVLLDQTGAYILETGKYIGKMATFLKSIVPAGVKIPYIAPHGLRTALGHVAAKGTLAVFWLAWSAEVFWEEAWQVDQQIQRTVAADTILCYVFDRENIERALHDPLVRVQAYACASYCGYMTSTIMTDFLDRRSIVGVVRNLWTRLSNQAVWEALNKRTTVRRTAKEEMLGHSSFLETWLATAHQPYAGLQVSTEPSGAEIWIDDELQTGVTTPCCLIVDLKSDEPETHTITVRLPGNKPESCSVTLRDEDVREVFLNFADGNLDVVLCIDKSGSMVDDIEAVQEVLDEVLQELNAYASENNISLQLGLVTYTRHDDVSDFGPQWLQAQPLTSDVEKIKQSIANIKILGAQAGAGGWEDMYAALLCGMGAQDLLKDEQKKAIYGQPDGSENLLDMGWRPGACKICLPIGDEPPSDPDWKDRTLGTVVTRAEELDPVHMYPIVVQGPIESWLLGTKKAMTNLAERTGGQITRVSKAEELPPALVKTVKLAVRRHRNEIWRKEHPPYALYIMALVIGLVVISAFVGVFVAQFRRQPEQAPRRS